MGCLQVHQEGERVGKKVLAMGTKTSWKDRIFHLSVDYMKAEFPWENKETISNLDLQISMSDCFFIAFFQCSLLLVSCIL